ncbi:dimethyladenosine transferase 2, mitochondrial isoform X1 [Trichechus manatus latirostris]|uniref:rRNA adenine N(6)-methyltransferase n=1 Tax=Trichechus manatus latirostris TaxID=127582 RepID=A0A2Y9DJV3_TRIMA|nr:dimethyladenosine transferase 2, mitochondrial isoform X1 [Trichechus manatus latirostris]
MWVTVAGLPARLTLSVLTGAGRFSILGSGVATRKDLPEVLRRGFSDSRPQPLPCPDIRESSSCVSKCRLDYKRYVISRRLAETLAQILQGKRKTPQLVLECNPGPGILTQALLETGARVIALESDKTFIPHLESLGKNLDGQLDVVHCDFFKLDPRNGSLVKPPIMISQMLFQNLGIRAVPWSAGIPLKVIGIFPIKSEKKALWKLIYDLYSCTSVYRYGRVELNMFISEKEYQKLKARPKNPNLYQALSVLWQVACDIKLLHMEPWSSFDLHTQNGQLEKTKRRELSELIQQNLCFIRMTPRRNLFTENLTPINYDVFFHMLKQCFGKRNAKLVDHLHSLSPVDAKDILTLIRKHENVKITNICPEDFKLLFETIECSKDYNCKWLCDDIMEDRIM